MNATISRGRLLAALLLLICVAVPAIAQLDTGRIVGTAKDKSGAGILKASVKATNLGTGRVYEATTDERGEYVIPALPVGTYKVEVAQSGFKTSGVTDISLHTGEAFRADVVLPVAGAAEEVTVTGQSTPVNTTTSETGGVIDSRTVTDLPLNGRDFTSLLTLVPGSVSSAPAAQNSLGGYETFLAGANVLLDGTDATRVDTNAVDTSMGRQQSRISRASLDSIREFRVLSSTYSAEYGRSMGDVVNVITKSGTNAFHGNIFEFFRNDAMDARNYFAISDTPLHMNDFGGNIAGPLKKDKLFFFVNYEGVRRSVGTPVKVQVLNDATRALANPADAGIQALLAAIPHGNGGPVPNSQTGLFTTIRDYYFGVLNDHVREDTGSVKIDWIAGAKDNFTFRYNIADSYTENQYGVATGQISPNNSRNHLFKASWTHTFSPTILNEAAFAFNRPQTDSLGGGGDFNVVFQCPAILGCTEDNDPGVTPGPSLFSILSNQKSFELIDNVTVVKGRHTIKFGVDSRKAITTRGLEPQYFLNYWPGLGLDFISNVAFSLSTLGYTPVDLSNWNHGLFVQDDFRIHPRFTINIGLRYDYNTVLQGDQVANFNVDTLTVGQPGVPLYNPDRNNFAPRIGFAWDLFGSGKTVVRGGYGIFYSPLLTGAALSLAQNTQPSMNVNLFDLFGGTTCNGNPLSYPLPADISCTPTPPQSVNALTTVMPDTYSQHWSFGVQQELLRNTVLEVSYVGNHGLKLPAGAAYAGQELNLSPFGGKMLSPDYENIRRLGNYLKSNYNALQVSLRRHMGKGLTLDANYTWSHEFDDAVNIFNAFQNSADPMMDWAPGDIDVRNNFTLGLVYDIPVAQSLPRRLAEGWQISTLLQARSGLPYTIALAPPFLGIDQLRPNLVPGVDPFANSSVPDSQINPAAFVAPPAGEYGNVPRNFGRGPGFNQLDFALSKTTGLSERYKLQFRAEAFNLFNHPNFANPVSVLNSSDFGKSVSTIGNKVGTGTSRQMQLAVKFLF